MRLWPESPRLVLCWVCRLVSPHVVGITPGVLSQILLYCPYQISLVSATSKDVVHGKMEISLPSRRKPVTMLEWDLEIVPSRALAGSLWEKAWLEIGLGWGTWVCQVGLQR